MRVEITHAPGRKCARCWKILLEVESSAYSLCDRCEAAVMSWLVANGITDADDQNTWLLAATDKALAEMHHRANKEQS